jgi:hypothetical protein
LNGWPDQARHLSPSRRTDRNSHTLGVGPEVWRVLAKGHEIRNLGEYEGDLNINERIVADMLSACRVVAGKLNELPALR